MTGGDPYTAAVEEKRKFGTPWLTQAAISDRLTAVLFR